jgi:sialic acid synthase SpsE
VLDVEQELFAFARRSIFAARAIRKGERFSSGNVAVLRNGTNAPGLPPGQYDRLLCCRASQDIAAHVPIVANMVDGGADGA